MAKTSNGAIKRPPRTKLESLVNAVSNHVKNPIYISGCGAFGIIDKLLNCPLRRLIENSAVTGHIFDLNEVLVEFKTYLEMYSQDASDLVHGKILYENHTNIDVFGCLFFVDDEKINILTTEALQIILLNFQLILERQLSDCLPGGILNEKTVGVDENLRDTSKTVTPANII